MAGRPQESAETGPSFQLAMFLNSHWDDLVSKTNKEIASELGYRQGNMVSMFRTGATRVPLEKLPYLTQLLRQDMKKMLVLWLEQYWGELTDGESLLGIIENKLVSDTQVPLMNVVRKVRSETQRFTKDELEAIHAVLTNEEAKKAALAALAAVGPADRRDDDPNHITH